MGPMQSALTQGTTGHLAGWGPQALCVWMKERTSSLDNLSGSWGFWESCTRMPSPHSQKSRP